MDWEKFFLEHEDYRLTVSFYENRRSFSLEDLYQAFRARMMQEVHVDVPNTSHYGLLVERIPGGDGSHD